MNRITAIIGMTARTVNWLRAIASRPTRSLAKPLAVSKKAWMLLNRRLRASLNWLKSSAQMSLVKNLTSIRIRSFMRARNSLIAYSPIS